MSICQVSESLLRQDINGQFHTVCVKEFLVPLRGRYKVEGSKERIRNTWQLLGIKEDGFPRALPINITTQAADGLFYLHSWGVLHTDIKVCNVFLGAGKRNRQLDYTTGGFWGVFFQLMQYNSTEVLSLWGIPSKKGMIRATTPFLESGPMPKAN